jgi:hypothetical protein
VVIVCRSDRLSICRCRNGCWWPFGILKMDMTKRKHELYRKGEQRCPRTKGPIVSYQTHFRMPLFGMIS